MTATLALLLAFSVSGSVRSGAHALLDHFAEGGGGGSDTGKVRVLVQPQQAMAKAQADDDAEEGDSDADSDTDLEAVPPPPAPPRLPRIKIDLDRTIGTIDPLVNATQDSSAPKTAVGKKRQTSP